MNKSFQNDEIKSVMMDKWNLSEQELEDLLYSNTHIFDTVEVILLAKSYFEQKLSDLKNTLSKTPYGQSEQVILNFDIRVVETRLKQYDTILNDVNLWTEMGNKNYALPLKRISEYGGIHE